MLGLASGFASSSATIGAMGGSVRATRQCLNVGAAAALTALGRSGLFAASGYREPAAEAPWFGQSLRVVMAPAFAVLPLLLA